MKKVFTVLSLVLLIFAQSCGKEPAETEKETVKLPEPVSESYGTEWAYAGMDKQIEADDPDFSVTGAGFEYRDGWFGMGGVGYFDLTTVYEPGSDEKFSLEFDMFIKDSGVLWLGIWLYGKDSLPDDGMPGEWIKLYENGAEYNGQTFAFGRTGYGTRSCRYRRNVFFDKAHKRRGNDRNYDIARPQRRLFLRE